MLEKLFPNLKSEFIKTKRTASFVIPISFGIVLPLLFVLMYRSAVEFSKHELFEEVPWNIRLATDIAPLVFMLVPMFSILVTSLIVYIETRNNTWKQIYASPRGWWNIVTTKFIVIACRQLLFFVIATAILTSLFVVNGWVMQSPLPLASKPHLVCLYKLIGLLVLCALLISLVQFILSLAVQNVIFQISIGVVFLFASIGLSNPANQKFFPYAYSRIVYFRYFELVGNRDSRDGEQRPDPTFDANIATPKFVERRPIILYDQGHNNRHFVRIKANAGTVEGTYSAFARLAENDGSQVIIADAPFTEDELRQTDLVVIVSAVGNQKDLSAFKPEEVDTIRNYVFDGGSLLLITDHYPFSTGSGELGNAFDVEFTIGTVYESTSNQGRIVFTKPTTISEHPVTESVRSVISYVGQGVRRQKDHTYPILLFSEKAYFTREGDRENKTQDDKPLSARGYAQLIAFNFGKGKVVVSGEAALFTAQIKSGSNEKIGMNDPHYDNRQLVINTLRWLLT